MTKEPGREKEEGPSLNSEEIPKIQPIQRPWNVTALASGGLFILAIFFTLYAAREFLLPVTLAWMLSMLLSPGVRMLNRFHIPNALGAAILLLGLISIAAAGFLLLSEPAANWLQKAPESLEKVEKKIRSFQDSAHEITRAAESVQHIAETTQNETPKVELKRPGILSQVWTQAKGALVMSVEVFVLLYFFLAAGDIFTLKLIQIPPRLTDKKRAIEMTRETQKSISQFLISMTLVNLIEGT